MKDKFSRRRAVAVAVAMACVLLLAAIAYADPPSMGGVGHGWVKQVTGAPSDTPTQIELTATKAAAAALKQPEVGLLGQSGRADPQAKHVLALATSLKDAAPTIVGHEVIVWNGDKAARFYVGEDGQIQLLQTGRVRPMLVSTSAAPSDAGDRNAVAVATQVLNLASELDPRVKPALGGLVAAHGVGFAKKDGSHIVVRVGLDGTTSYPDW